jgi:hypothetical protein
LMMYAIFQQISDNNDHDENKYIAKLIEISNFHTRERIPFSMLEYKFSIDLLGVGRGFLTNAQIAELSMIGSDISPIYMSDEEMYIFTHEIFYLTSFGRSPLPFSRNRINHIKMMTKYLTGMCLFTGNWDLVAELIISHLCLNYKTSPFYRSGILSLVHVQRGDGSVPGPAFKQGELEALEVSNQEQYVFETCYHSTLVGTIMGSLCAGEEG